jgi:hypothetical protein
MSMMPLRGVRRIDWRSIHPCAWKKTCSKKFEPFKRAASGTFTQLGFEVEDIGAVVADLRSRGVVFEEFDLPPDIEVEDGIVKVEDNYPSKGVGERGIWFRDSEGNLLALGQPVK